MSKNNEHEKIIKELEALRETPERDPKQAARARAQFLLAAKRISEEPVSISWFQRLSNVFQAPQMRTSTLTIMITLVFLLISFGTSTATASQALPDQFLYPYKLWLEDQRLALTFDQDKEAELHLRFAQERLAELEALSSEETEEYLESLLDNYNHHLNAAEEFILESEDHHDKEEMLHNLETQAPQPTLEDALESEPTETPEPEPSEEPEETEEVDETEEPDGSKEENDDEEQEETESSSGPTGTPDPDDDDEDDDDEDDNSESESTDEPDETKEPEETEDPDD